MLLLLRWRRRAGRVFRTVHSPVGGSQLDARRTLRLECVHDLDVVLELEQLLLDLVVRGGVHDEHVHQFVGEQLARVADVDGGF